MIWVASMICYICAIYHIYINKGKIVTTGGIIALLWGTVNLISAISPYDWFVLHDECNRVIFIGSISFCIGLLVNKPIKYVGNFFGRDVSSKDCYREFFILQIIIIIIMVPMVIKAITIIFINNFDMTVMRSVYGSGGENGSYMSTFERLFYIHYIVGPLAFASILIDILLYFRYKMWKKPLLYCVILSLFLAIYSAARTSVFFAAILLLIVYMKLKGHATESYDTKFIRRRIKRIIFILICLLIVVTLLRGKSNSNPISYIIKSIITYFCGGSHVLGVIMDNQSYFGLDSYSYGYCTFAGLFSICNLLNMYLLVPIKINLFPYNFAANMHVQDYVAQNVHIGLNSTMNAFPTMFYFFLRDGGLVYLIISVFVFGRILTYFERKSAQSDKLIDSFTACLLLYVAIMSVCWWEPIRTEFWMILIWGRIICRKLDEKEKRMGRKEL